jgi:hypothetical protein
VFVSQALPVLTTASGDLPDKCWGILQQEGARWTGTIVHHDKGYSDEPCDCWAECCQEKYDSTVIGYNFRTNDITWKTVCDCIGADGYLVNLTNSSKHLPGDGDAYGWCGEEPPEPSPLPCASQTQTEYCIPVGLPSDYVRFVDDRVISRCDGYSDYHKCSGTDDPWPIDADALPMSSDCHDDDGDAFYHTHFGVCIEDGNVDAQWESGNHQYMQFLNADATEMVVVHYLDHLDEWPTCSRLNPLKPPEFFRVPNFRILPDIPDGGNYTKEVVCQVNGPHGQSGIDYHCGGCADAFGDLDEVYHALGTVRLHDEWYVVESASLV